MQKIRFDFWFTAAFITLVGFGISVIFSASSATGLDIGDVNYYLKRHLINIAIGIAAFIIAAKLPAAFLRKGVWAANIAASILLLLLFVDPLNVDANGAGRWLSIAGFTFQPSEIAKLVVIFTLAHLIDRNKERLNAPKTIGVIALYVAWYCGLILAKTHLSAIMVILGITLVVLIAAGIAKRYLFMLGGLAVAGGLFGILLEPFRIRRLFGFLNPEADPLGDGFHIIQSWYAIGSGEMFGLGLGMSRQKFTWLPENHTDFIVGVIGEEVGFVGISVLLFVFCMFILQGLNIASGSPDVFSSLLVSGVIAWISIQFFINIAVVTGWFPVTGMPVPFISYGGSSTIVLFAGVGLIYNVISQIHQKKSE